MALNGLAKSKSDANENALICVEVLKKNLKKILMEPKICWNVVLVVLLSLLELRELVGAMTAHTQADGSLDRPLAHG